MLLIARVGCLKETICMHIITPGKSFIGRYQLERVLGRGAMGEVYEATLLGPAGFRKKVALKVIYQAEKLNSHRSDLINEARFGGLLKHPNVVETYELGQDEDRLFIAMEFIDGLTLASLIFRKKVVPPQAALDICGHICQGLRHIHQLQIDGRPAKLVHRDLKPSNILIDKNGLVKIADFGIARAFGIKNSKEGKLRGTPAYMSPEQVLDEPLDGRSDLFTLGTLLYEMLTGERLFMGSHPFSLMGQIRNVDSIFTQRDGSKKIKNLSPALFEFLQTCLRLRPEDRFSTAGELYRQLRLLPKFPGDDLYAILNQGPLFVMADKKIEVSEEDKSPQIDVEEPSTIEGINPTSSFVGREKILQQINNLLPKGRVCLKGTIGIGKSRLALEFISAYGSQWSQCLFVELSEVSSTEDLYTKMFRVLRLKDKTDDHDISIVIEEHLCSLENTLIVLDHLDSLTNWEPISKWFEKAKNASFLVTSRIGSQLPNQKIIEVPPLTLHFSKKLFQDRLRERSVSITVQERVVHQLLHKLDGIPLAIELVAASIHTESSLTSIQQVLRDQTLLKSNPLHAAIQYSWNLLSSVEQKVLCELSVFSGVFSIDSADSVVQTHEGNPWVGDVIASLLNQSLVYTKPGDGEPYFQLYSSVRTFILQKKPIGKNQKYRHASYFARWINVLPEFSAQYIFEKARDRHLSNFLFAVKNALQYGWHDIAVRTGLAAARIFLQKGPYSRGHSLVHRLLREKRCSLWEQGQLLLALGAYSRLSGDCSRSIEHLKRALSIFQQLDDSSSQMQAWTSLISSGADAGDFSWVAKAQQAISVLGVSEVLLHGQFKRAIGYALAQRGDLQQAQGNLTRSVNELVSQGDLSTAIAALTSLGVISYRQNNLKEAVRYYRKALQLAQKSGLTSLTDHLWMNWGLIAAQEGDFERAKTLLLRAESHYKMTGGMKPLSLLYANFGLLLLFQNDFVAAKEKLSAALQMQKKHPHPIAGHTAYKGAGLLALCLNQRGKAKFYFTKALSVVETHQLRYKAPETHAFCAEVYALLEDFETANSHLSIAASTIETDPAQRILWLCATAAIAFAQKEIERGKVVMRRAEEELQHLPQSRPDLRFQIQRLHQMLYTETDPLQTD